jgi:DNA-binding transcriptional regulator YdaS (Cro superfamily)
MSTSPLDEVLAIVGSLQALATHLGVTKGAVAQWKLPGRRIPAEYCPTIEKLVHGKVKCEAMRPDVDWGYVRGNSPVASGCSAGGKCKPHSEKIKPQ